MDSSLRASAFAGLGAFVLSSIVAAFSRVPFGALFFRALLSGIGFACLCYLGLWMLRRFMPELFDDSARASPVGAGSGIGSIVDIVLPGGDEEGHDGDSVSSVNYTNDIVADVMAPGFQASLSSGEIEQEVANLRADVLIPNDPSDTAADSRSDMLLRPSVSLDELDTLPDLDGMSDSFAGLPSASSDTAGGQSGDESSRFGVSESMPTAGSPNAGQDPAALAKAVQTLLRRDQKGQ